MERCVPPGAARNLRLLFDPASTTDSIIITINSREECWFRFRARNEVGREVAAGVQLLLLEARREDAAQHHAVPMRPFQATDLEAVRVEIPAGVDRPFDIFHLERDSSPSAERPTVPGLVLALTPQSRVRRDHLAPGRYCLALALIADNCDATYWQADLLFKKQWLLEGSINDSVEVSAPVRVDRR